ncbi:hypothetical protein [Hymenobacter persicinus]|uniref:Uncharacterized protein n=1 Tax=Hymenobacter persicinus TaxID=2025506 RepID=A0A4Q5LCQ1_9BACT|nr:hypothetical protein [Hymenobacter persicinus]RYU80997.1 hypothetical protein EWM57_07080 [Hymenobacter persicinus]
MRVGNARRWLLAGLLLGPGAGAQPKPPGPRGPFLTLQVGGGLGLLALGGGYRGNPRLEPELLVGYVPRALSSRPLFIFTAKATYVPRYPRLRLGEQWQAQPLAVGSFVSYSTGRQFFLGSARTGRYAKGYYWWPTALRLGAAASLRVVRAPPAGPGFRQLLYSEWSTNDLYLVSKAANRRLRASEIMVWGAGAKAGW